MRRAAPLVLAVVLLSACVAVTVQRHHPRKGPVKEVGYVDLGGGEVRYSAEGWGLIVASRRKTALKLMSSNCGSDLTPAITDEFPRMDADATYNGEDIDASMKSGDQHYLIERYIHIAYECRPKGFVPLAVGVTTTTVSVEASTAPAAAPSISSATLAAPEPPR